MLTHFTRFKLRGYRHEKADGDDRSGTRETMLQPNLDQMAVSTSAILSCDPVFSYRSPDLSPFLDSCSEHWREWPSALTPLDEHRAKILKERQVCFSDIVILPRTFIDISGCTFIFARCRQTRDRPESRPTRHRLGMSDERSDEFCPFCRAILCFHAYPRTYLHFFIAAASPHRRRQKNAGAGAVCPAGLDSRQFLYPKVHCVESPSTPNWL